VEAVKRIIVETGNNAVTYQHLDLTSLDSIKKFSSNVERCHVLVNNAGAMFTEPGFVQTVERTFFTNYLGPFLLTKLMLPVLVRTSLEDNTEVRVVMVGSRSEKSSPLGAEYSHSKVADVVSGNSSDGVKKMWFETCTRGPQPYELWTAYGTSKLCDMLFAYELDRRLARSKHSSLAVAAAIPQPSSSFAERSDALPTSSLTPPVDTDRSQARITVNSVTPGMVNSDLARWAPLWKLYLSYPVRTSALKTVDQGAC
jgi:NAD(P)-dependent dehydrogenase (short-subunit alcohol dehydrogenase family)